MNPIALLTGLLGGKAWLAWLVAAGVGLASLAGLYAYVDHQGYARAEAKWSQRYDAREAELQAVRFRELDRQATANAEAKARETEIITALAAEIAALEAAATENDRGAEADPNRDRVGLGADSINRLNRIR